jgi:acyl-coenzyme A thioesterase PaaI-like protein
LTGTAETPLDVREIFRTAPFMAPLGIELESGAHGECHTRLRVCPDICSRTASSTPA